MGHYSNECDEEQTIKMYNKKESNFLITNKDGYHGSSDEDDNRTGTLAPSYRDINVLEEEF